jgi:hypothetical protein
MLVIQLSKTESLVLCGPSGNDFACVFAKLRVKVEIPGLLDRGNSSKTRSKKEVTAFRIFLPFARALPPGVLFIRFCQRWV